MLDADFAGTSREDCTSGGACWVFIKARFWQFMYGFYPLDQRWRVNLAFLLLIGALIPLFLPRVRHKLALAAGILVLYPIVAYCLFYGGVLGLPVVETARWGGLFLTLVIAGVGIVASLPLGILFALGRRSDMPIVRAICITFIEVMRGVPLITILFMASVMLPLFLPPGVNFDKLLRALVGVALFSAAYMAEVVRGGLQAIPKGQYEAAQALGLSYWKMMGLIVLPQALAHRHPRHRQHADRAVQGHHAGADHRPVRSARHREGGADRRFMDRFRDRRLRVRRRSVFGSSASPCRATACTSSASSAPAAVTEGTSDDGAMTAATRRSSCCAACISGSASSMC